MDKSIKSTKTVFTIKKNSDMKDTAISNRHQTAFQIQITRTFSSLVRLKNKGERSAFYEVLLEILPQVKKYVNRRLEAAIHQGHFSKGKYKADDIVDQLFIEVYDSIEGVKNESEFNSWLFKKTNQLLEDTIIEEGFDDYFFKNIDDYSKGELDSMVEKFSTDGDGDLVMLEELDDQSYRSNESFLNHVFVENNEKELVNKLDKELTEKDLRNHISMIMTKLPLGMRNVFDLYTSEQFSIAEIADITKNSVEEVQQLLEDAQKRIKLTFAKRF